MVRRIFLSTPSARRATGLLGLLHTHIVISIHALREEGDCPVVSFTSFPAEFLSTPSARRATQRRRAARRARQISIHALREEGDTTTSKMAVVQKISIHALREEGDGLRSAGQRLHREVISIHALREEGDRPPRPLPVPLSDFYPRPP